MSSKFNLQMAQAIHFGPYTVTQHITGEKVAYLSEIGSTQLRGCAEDLP